MATVPARLKIMEPGMETRDAALSFRSVTFGYRGRAPVLSGVDLRVPRGELTVILGANGSGKTTLLKLAAGLLRPSTGDVLTQDGTPVHEAMRRGRIGYIPQQLGLVRPASVLANTVMGGLRDTGPFSSLLGLVPSDVRDRAFDALDAVGLREKAALPIKEISGGERQRVAIARTLVQRPDFIVADELIASLDTVQAHAVMDMQRELKRRGVTTLMSLHHIDVALANADKVSFLVDGRLSALRSPEGMTVEEARCAFGP